MEANSFQRLLRTLADVEWGWTEAEWLVISKSLGLIEIESFNTRISYLFSNAVTIHAMIWQGNLLLTQVLLETSYPSEVFSEEEWESNYKEFRGLLERYVSLAESVIGKPDFRADLSQGPLPDDEDARAIAVWPLPNALLMVCMEANPPDEPFVLALEVRPRSI